MYYVITNNGNGFREPQSILSIFSNGNPDLTN